MRYIQCNRCVFHPNDKINDYQVVKMLGAGSFGCVYEVTDKAKQTYALKLLKLWEIPSSEREELMKRFDMEYETGRINSNYLVRSYTKGEIEGNPYIVMEYCPNGDLMSAAESGSVNFTKVGKDILFGLRDLHQHGKVHRDLKPENVLIRKDGSAVLTDFGISGDQNNRLTQRGIFGVPQQRFGTFAYMPPEQINPRRGNATVLPTTDIFSFGVMMYQLVTYELPFGDLVDENDLNRYTSNGKAGKWNRELLSKATNGYKWENLIEGCLKPNFKERLQSVDEVLKLMPKDAYNEYKPVYSKTGETRNTIKNGVMLRVMQGEDFNRTYRLNEFIKGRSKIITIGRSCEDVANQISITDEMNNYVSRCHCTLELNVSTGEWILRDGQWRANCQRGLLSPDPYPCALCQFDNNTGNCPMLGSTSVPKFSWKSSTNGTYINSSEVGKSGALIKLGDIITIGDVKLRVEGY